ncbi:hypothetical protein [Agrobacterium tumefaciens]|uniref:Methyltransferase n=1 Tax=Agrobacterium tumefaciens TaxID=358 RepID=A0A176X1Y3_AGRTU|nr:hypothetical protein [Agrobacterium tumefaciens]OAE40677.1 hypothetical protein A7J57_10485 [Agrobacterium tumefaciens]
MPSFKQFKDAIRNMAKVDVRALSKIDGLSDSVDTITRNQALIEQGQAAIEQGQSSIVGDLAALNEAMKSLAEEVRDDWVNKIEKHLEAINSQSWHQKEAAHAAVLASLTQGDRILDPKKLSRHYSQVYSQNCEDGYIAEIFSRIGTKSRTFLEIGIEDGTQNTTRFLLETGWTGVWVEGDLESYNRASEIFRDFILDGSLQIIHLLTTTENINSALDEHGVRTDFDFVSVDIDHNTSHVWRALNRVGRVSCIEFNASIPASIAVEVPYDPSAQWDGSNFFGASLKTMELIGRSKKMNLVGCDFQGVNCYFVNEDEDMNQFREPFTAENHYEIPKYRALSQIGHPPSGKARRWSAPRGI